jgi:toxin ParE1/3/4
MGITLSPKALLDLDGIYNYSLRTWGSEQAYQYQARIFSTLDLLIDSPKLGRFLGGRFGNVRALKVEQHVAYYQIEQGHIRVVRVIHPKQQTVLTVK